MISFGLSPSCGNYCSGTSSPVLVLLEILDFLWDLNLSFDEIFSTNLNLGASETFLFDLVYLTPSKFRKLLSSNIATPSVNVLFNIITKIDIYENNFI